MPELCPRPVGPRRRAGGNHPSRPQRGGTGGQATVELALGLPVVFLAVLLVLQLALVGRDLVLVTHAAREAARQAAVVPTESSARRGALRASGGLDSERLDVTLSRRGSLARVEVRYLAITGLPLVGHLVPDRHLTASATVAVEDGG